MAASTSTTDKNPASGIEAQGAARLAEASQFEGHWIGDDLFVQGRFDGELDLSGWLRIGRGGRVQGRVSAASAEVSGEFDGEIRTKLLIFGESARARGTFLSERLIMKDGAQVDGSFAPTGAAKAPTVVPTLEGKSPAPPKAPIPPEAEKTEPQAIAPAPPAPEGASEDPLGPAGNDGVATLEKRADDDKPAKDAQ